jgi:hypothetical protein
MISNNPQSRQYFQQPDSKKSEFAIHSEKAGGMNRGWVKMQGESLDPSGQKVYTHVSLLSNQTHLSKFPL